MVIETFDPKETYDLGVKMGEQAQAGQVICLNGDLGVGKTVFTQGFAAGLGITEPVNSPTFTIVQQYEDGRLPLYHFDVYRIGDISEMDEIGYEDCFYGQGVTLIEWSELIREILPERIWKKDSTTDESVWRRKNESVRNRKFISGSQRGSCDG